MKKRYAIWFVIGVLLLLIVFPYAKVEFLTINADKKLESFDISYFDNVYCEGTPKIYDCKIYSYQKDRYVLLAKIICNAHPFLDGYGWALLVRLVSARSNG